jgi:outer membrane lipoprotein-sorting protein
MNRRTLMLGSLALAAVAAGSPALAQIEALSRPDRALVDQAAAYLQGMKAAKAHFTQTTSRGGQSSGTLYLSRPGKARFEYAPPAGMLVVADGRNVAVYDKRLKTFDKYPLGATPLGIFLSRRIDLSQDVKVVRVNHTPGGFGVVLTDPHAQADGQLILEFSTSPLALTGWTVIDGQGAQTRVRLSGLAPARSLDSALFTLNDPRKAG